MVIDSCSVILLFPFKCTTGKRRNSLFQTGILGNISNALNNLNISHVVLEIMLRNTAIICNMTMNSNAKFHGKFSLVSNSFNAQAERSFKLKLQEFVEYF